VDERINGEKVDVMGEWVRERLCKVSNGNKEGR